MTEFRRAESCGQDAGYSLGPCNRSNGLIQTLRTMNVLTNCKPMEGTP